MKKLLCAVLVAIAVNCVGVQKACAYDFYPYRDYTFNISVGGGASLVDGGCSPTFGLRGGLEGSILLIEGEFSFLSIEDNKRSNLSTMTAGANIGAKLVQGRYGYLAAMLYTGYAIQEDRFRGRDCGYYGCYDDYCYDCYGYYDYGCGYDCYDYYCQPRRDYHGKMYFGIGLQGTVDFSRFGIFAEARFQNLPVKGLGEDKWGLVASAGFRFYF